MIIVKDGPRQLKFNGHKIASSTSYESHKARWVEFHLYQTQAGKYVLSRIGASRFIHLSSDCSTVKRNKIKEVPAGDIEMENAVVCDFCNRFTGVTTVIYPEVPRYWSMVTDSAESLIDSLYKEDYNGSRYLTDVSRRLLDDASDKDADIAKAYLTEFVD